jgi:hypothetical protein
VQGDHAPKSSDKQRRPYNAEYTHTKKIVENGFEFEYKSDSCAMVHGVKPLTTVRRFTGKLLLPIKVFSSKF